MTSDEQFLLYLDELKTIENHFLVESIKEGFISLNEYLYAWPQVGGQSNFHGTDIMENGDDTDFDSEDEFDEFDDFPKIHEEYDEDDEEAQIEDEELFDQIKQSLEEDHGTESEFAQRQLLGMANALMDITEMFDKKDHLPEWVSMQISKAAQMISDVRSWAESDDEIPSAPVTEQQY